MVLNCSDSSLQKAFNSFKQGIISRGEKEITYWQNEISVIKTYSKAEAITRLISSLKLNEKINSINAYINQLRS